MKKMKKTIIASMSMLVLLTLLGGCANTSQGEVPSIDYGSTEADTQMVEAQDETNINVKDEQGRTAFIDEKLDENLFISAELKMPENNLYEYVTQLKSFDYDIVQEAIGQNTEGNFRLIGTLLLMMEAINSREALLLIKEMIWQTIWTPIVPMQGRWD